jgi:hypothetical protein
MALKLTVNPTEHATLDEAIRNLYIERDGVYTLDLSDKVVESTKLDEFRDNNRKLAADLTAARAALEPLKNVDPAEYARLKEVEAELSKKGIKKTDDIATRIQEAVEASLKPVSTKLAAVEQQLAEKDKALAETTRREKLREVAANNGVDDAMFDEFVVNMRQFGLIEGKLAARDANGAVVITEDGHPLTPDLHVRSLRKAKPGLFKADVGSGSGPLHNRAKATPGVIGVSEIGANLEAVAQGKVSVATD